MTITTCIFDAYGTLFDVTSAARSASREPGFETFAKVWTDVARDWRQKQLSYTWLRALTQAHVPFWQVTGEALDWALERNGADAIPGLRDRLLKLYWELEAYPEVSGVLQHLKNNGLICAILSNGNPEMLRGSVESAGLGPLLDDVISVERAGVFKPDRRVYDLVGATFGTAPEAVMFVSSNGWDVAGASAYGFRTLWVNRAGDPIDRLPGRPDHVAETLDALPALIGVS